MKVAQNENINSLLKWQFMKHKFKYFMTALMPGFIMFGIDEFIIGILCLFLQMSVVGWPIASIWAIATLKKYYKKQVHQSHTEKEE